MQQTPSQTITRGCQTSPPYLQILALRKPSPYPKFEFLGELQNLFVKNPLIQAVKDVLIYAKKIKEYCSKKPNIK